MALVFLCYPRAIIRSITIILDDFIWVDYIPIGEYIVVLEVTK